MATNKVQAEVSADVTPFQREIAKAQKSLGELVDRSTKKFTDFKDIGQTLATSLGLNMQSIAEGLARFVTGFTKDEEERLSNLVKSTEDAARQQEAALVSKQKEMEAIRKKVAAEDEKDRIAGITFGDRLLELANEKGKLETKVITLQKQGRTETLAYIKSRERLQEIENEVADIHTRQAEQKKKAFDLENNVNKELTDFFSFIDERQKKQKEADEKRLETLKDQTTELQKQAGIKQTEINDSRRQAELPTMAEVISGKRNIGTVAKTRATALERARAKELQLSDAEQRAREAYANAPTESAKAAALAQGRGIRSKLDMTRTQIQGLEKQLGFRIKDADPYSVMIKELANIYNELDKLNTRTLASTSVK